MNEIAIIKHTVLFGVLILFFYQSSYILKIDSFTREYLIIAILSLVIILYYNYQIHKKIFAFQERLKSEKRRIERERDFVKYFLNEKYDDLTSKQLSELINSTKFIFHPKEATKGYEDEFKIKQEEAKRALEKIKHKEEIEALTSKKSMIEDEIKASQQKIMSDEDKILNIRRELHLEKNKVFLAEDLTDEQIAILKNEGYKQVNEYDISRKDILTILVRPVLNHSATHTFLVWSIIRYLEQIGMSNIQEHETRDADVTFKHENRIYALEIETGNLLKKQKQLNEKIAYLGNKYRNRWMFIVSNKDLVSKYRKYGLSTHRKGMEENLQKLIKNTHPAKSGGKR